MQQSVQQLVISNQTVIDDELALDKISSTMNGFVDLFAPVRTYKDGDWFVVEADIHVSQSRLKNFVGLVQGGRASIDSDSILAAAQAETLSRKARAEVAAALFRDFPSRALEVSAPTFALNANDPDLVDYSIDIRWAPGFLASLTEGLRALGAEYSDCRKQVHCGRSYTSNSLQVCLSHEDWRMNEGGYVRPLSIRSLAADCYLLAPVDLTHFGKPENGNDGLAWFSCPTGVCVSGEFSSALVTDGRLLDLAYAGTGFSSAWENNPYPKQSEHLTIFIDARTVKIFGSLPAQALAGVSSVDAIPLATYMGNDPPGWGISYRERPALADEAPDNLMFLETMFPAVQLVRYQGIDDLLSELILEYSP